jgi:hypothetical protein
MRYNGYYFFILTDQGVEYYGDIFSSTIKYIQRFSALEKIMGEIIALIGESWGLISIKLFEF